MALRSSRFMLVVAVVALTGSACGSIVSQEAFRNAAQTGQSGGDLSIGGQSGTPGTLGPGSPTPGLGSPVGGATPGAPGLGGPATTAVAPGVTATTIYVGASYTADQSEGNAAIGGGSAEGSDARDAYNVMFDEINRLGGIAGRKVVPIYFGYRTTSNEPVDQQAQAACAKWTQDNKVFVIFGGQFPVERECAKKAGIVEYWSPAGSNSVPETFQQNPGYVEITGMNLVRLGPVTIDGLARQGYFDRGARIGIVAWDDPAYREGVQRGLIPALQSHGLNVAVQPIYVNVPQTIPELGGTTADVNGAVLKLSSRQVDHVLLVDGPAGIFGGAGLGFEFLNRAKAQRYYPRYGFNDNNLPVDALEEGLYPPDQLRGSIHVTWQNTDKATDAGWRTNATRQRCEDIMRKKGIAMGDVNARANALTACEELWFLQAVLAKIGRATITADAFMAGVNALGRGFASPSVYSTNFSASQHDGVAGVRIMRFNSSCSCFQYVTDPYTV